MLPKRDWRHRILWLSAAHANEALLTAFAVGMMALSIIATASRSGMACLIFAMMTLGWWTTCNSPPKEGCSSACRSWWP